MDFTQAWSWPQWAMAGWFFIGLTIACAQHGDEMRETVGPRKGEVRKYSFHLALLRVALFLFILIAGGFFS